MCVLLNGSNAHVTLRVIRDHQNMSNWITKTYLHCMAQSIVGSPHDVQ